VTASLVSATSTPLVGEMTLAGKTGAEALSWPAEDIDPLELDAIGELLQRPPEFVSSHPVTAAASARATYEL
jgi:hypothetical protein